MSAADYPRERLDALFVAIDSKHSNTFVDFLTEDAVFRFGSSPAAVGRDNIEAGVSAFFASIDGSSHQIDKVLANGDTLVCEGEVTYTRLDDNEVSVPFVDVFELEGPLIREYKIYIDISPLYAG